MRIALGSPLKPEDQFPARLLREELEAAMGRKFPAVSAPPIGLKGIRAVMLGRLDQPDVRKTLETRGISTRGVGEEGYVLDVGPDEVLVAGKDAAGVFYGVQTLRQLIVRNGQNTEVLGVRVRDWPALRYRGTQVDMSRGPVPKLSYLKRIVGTISEFKMNQLYMYIEDSFRLDGEPLVGILSDTLSRDDWKELVAYAASYHVEIIPATEGCGHLHKILRFEQYSGLAERPHGHVLTPSDPQALAFLDKMYGQMVPVFPASIVHIGCDETFELGKGKSAALAQQQGIGKVYVDNLIRVHDLVSRYNKQVMFWGDIALENPELIPSLPKDLIVASWEYSARPTYDKWLKPFEGTGMKIFVCPWVGNTNLMMPDYEEAAANIETFLTDGKKAGAIGTDITVWNDDGESLYGPNWWSIIYGAACAWEPAKTDLQDFDQKYDWAFHRNTDHRFTEALKKLSHINEMLRAGRTVQTYDQGYGGTSDALFWRDPFSPAGQNDVQKALPVVSQVRLAAEEAYTVFANNASRAQRNADTLADLRFAAVKLDALGMRYQFAQEISERYANAVAHQQDKDQRLVWNELSEIEGTNGRLQDLRDYTTRLRELYKELWLSENLPTWLPNMLQLYDRNSELWQGLISKFARIRRERGQGKPLPPADSLGLLPAVPINK